MGQSASLPEKVLKACDRGDVAYLQRQLNQGTHTRERLRALANSTNKVNQTALFIAVRGDHVAVVQMLLTAGADVSAHTGGNGPTALHEAARRRNLQIVELLLSYGANPFQQCSTGHTAFETAMLADAKPVVRRFAQMARWAGDVEVRSSGFFGSNWKSRHIKVVDHFLPPAGGVRPPPRRQLWVYPSAASIAPKCRLWLDGAVAFVSGATAVLRLSHEHGKPADTKLFWRRCNGSVCVFFKSEAGDSANWQRLMHECCAAHGSMPLALPSRLQTWFAKSSGTDMPLSALPLALPPAARPPAASFPAAPPPFATAHATGGLAATPSHQHTQSYSGPVGWAANFAPPAAPASWGGSVPSTPPRHHHTQSVGGVPITPARMMEQAQPGESDVEFAARLQGADPDAAAAIAAASAAIAGGNEANMTGGGATDGRPGGAATGGGGLGDGGRAPVGTPMGGGNLSAPLPLGVPGLQGEPSAPPPPPPSDVTAHGSGDADSDDSESGCCVICLDQPRAAGFLHGSTVHRCVCRGCAPSIRVGDPCPVCRQRIERVLDGFY